MLNFSQLNSAIVELVAVVNGFIIMIYWMSHTEFVISQFLQTIIVSIVFFISKVNKKNSCENKKK